MLNGFQRYSLPDCIRIAFDSVCLVLKLVLWVPYVAVSWHLARRRNFPMKFKGVFFYSQVVWQDVWQRPQEMSLRFSKHSPLIYFSPMQVHRRCDSVRNWLPHSGFPEWPNCHLFQPLIFPGEYKSAFVRLLNRQLIRAQAQSAMLKIGIPDTFLTNSPFYNFMAQDFAWNFQVYDVIDDFILANWAPPNSDREEQWLIQNSGLMFTGTWKLYETKGKLHDNIHFIPPGVDFDLFQFENTPPLPEKLKNIPVPRMGYIGTLSERIDSEMLALLSEKIPQASLVLIGPLRGTFSPKPEAPNIFYLGPCDHSEAPAYLAHFDLALIPFRVNDMTRSLYPIKTLEYLSAGRVVLSTALPDVERFYSEVVEIAQSPEEFVDKAEAILNSDRKEQQERGREIAKDHSWDNMAESMWGHVEGMRN